MKDPDTPCHLTPDECFVCPGFMDEMITDDLPTWAAGRGSTNVHRFREVVMNRIDFTKCVLGRFQCSIGLGKPIKSARNQHGDFNRSREGKRQRQKTAGGDIKAQTIRKATENFGNQDRAGKMMRKATDMQAAD